MPLDRRHAQAFALLGLVMILWAGNSIVARAVRHDIAPFTLALLRWTGASLVVAPFAIRPLMRLIGAFLSAALLGERLHGFHFTGMAFILAGIALSLLSGRRQEAAGAGTDRSLEDRR